MTSQAARTVSNAIVLSAGAAVAYVVITTPPLRRMALRAVRLWLGASIPVYLLGEVRRAWADSAPTG